MKKNIESITCCNAFADLIGIQTEDPALNDLIIFESTFAQPPAFCSEND